MRGDTQRCQSPPTNTPHNGQGSPRENAQAALQRKQALAAGATIATPEQSYWSTHQENIVISHNAEEHPEYRNFMCPQGLAVSHPAGALLWEYATYGCPTKTSALWKKEEVW